MRGKKWKSGSRAVGSRQGGYTCRDAMHRVSADNSHRGLCPHRPRNVLSDFGLWGHSSVCGDTIVVNLSKIVNQEFDSA